MGLADKAVSDEMEDAGKIWSDDHLNRQEDAKFLIEYLLQRNAFAIARGDHGTSINVSAPWGAGKTYFLSKMACQLVSDGYKVATVDAWRDDHTDDPIFAVMAAVLKALGKTKKTAKLRTALKNSAGKIAIRASKGLMSRGAAFLIGQSAVDGVVEEAVRAISEATEETASEFADRALKHFEDGQKAIDAFRLDLRKAVEGTPPLFVLIDELDRCRPTYAVALLERIKHLFDVDNVVVVVATHTDQLAHTIRAVYGSEFDAERYLLRFFDRTYSFDKPSLVQFVNARWEMFGFKNERFLPFRDVSPATTVAWMADSMNLSLRDVDQILGILWSVAESAEPRVPFPLMLAFPVVAAYHQRSIVAFEHVFDKGPSFSPMAEEAFRSAFPEKPFAEFEVYDRFGGRTRDVEHVSVRSLVHALRRLLFNGLTESFEHSTSVDRYTDEYRSREFILIHSNSFGARPVKSRLEHLSQIIKKAGRLSPASAA